jgi:orotidine-5'-phosphate decarboxylase
VGFGDRLAAAVAERRSQVLLGLDPDPLRLLPPALEAASGDTAAERAASAVRAHCSLLIRAAGAACVGVKLQLACFERLGPPGWRALFETAASAREAGLLVVADGKRGDVPHTAAAYAQALLATTPTPWGHIDGLGSDAVTVNPLLGAESLEPIIAAARAAAAGTFVLVRTSNPGAGELQDADVDGLPLHARLAMLVDGLGAGDGPLADVGAVVGATRPELLKRLRELMPRAVFLLPGVGAQGGRVADLAPAFAPGRAGGLVAVSRTISDAGLERGEGAARDAAEQIREAAWGVSGG